MSYQASRDAAQLDRLKTATDDFIQRWQQPCAIANRRTLFLLPGGMASALWRATTPYVDGGPAVQQFDFELNWVTLDTLFDTATELAMVSTPGGYRDSANRIVIADGDVEFEGVGAFSGFTDWCDAEGIDWFIFGWDWRRPVAESVNFFIDRFLPQFQSQVLAATGADPLANYYLLGHSFGGMFINRFVRQPDIPGNCRRAISVCGLFHGYGGQVKRWFDKDDMFYLYDTMTMIRTVTSLPGPYELPYLPEPSFQAKKGALATNQYPLAAYPSVDAIDSTIDADPYNPTPDRYPSNTGFDYDALAAAQNVYDDLAQPLTPARRAMFVAVRGIITEDDGVTPVATTPGGITWGHLPAGPYDPSQDPITAAAPVAGDGTLPAWSTYLTGAECRNVSSPLVDHVLMLYLPDTIAVLAQLLS